MIKMMQVDNVLEVFLFSFFLVKFLCEESGYILMFFYSMYLQRLIFFRTCTYMYCTCTTIRICSVLNIHIHIIYIYIYIYNYDTCIAEHSIQYTKLTQISKIRTHTMERIFRRGCEFDVMFLFT